MINPNIVIVIHESIINCPTLLLYHQSKNFRASYHACIDRLGTIIYLVPSYMKAFAAQNSQYVSPSGEIEQINGSVNDFAYHICLESPDNGSDKESLNHAGYTIEQYKSLAWLCSKTGVEQERIVTHGEVKLSNQSINDPRTFNKSKLYELLNPLTKERIIDFGVLE